MKIKLTVVGEFVPEPGHYVESDFTPGKVLEVEQQNLADMGVSYYLDVFDPDDIEVTLQIIEL